MEVLSTGCSDLKFANFTDHTHSYYEIIYSKSELVHLTLDGKKYDLTPGYVTVIPPGYKHSQMSDCPFIDMYLLALTADFNVPVIVYDGADEIRRLLDIMRGTALKRENHYQIINEYLFQTICLVIKRLQDRTRVKRITEDFRNHLIGEISHANFDVETAIRQTGYNPNYFRRVFREDFGQTPLEYLTWLRITNAKQLLVLDNFRSVSDIAEQCGFTDNLYFSTCFKKHVGRSPIKYRKFILSHKGINRTNHGSERKNSTTDK